MLRPANMKMAELPRIGIPEWRAPPPRLNLNQDIAIGVIEPNNRPPPLILPSTASGSIREREERNVGTFRGNISVVLPDIEPIRS